MKNGKYFWFVQKNDGWIKKKLKFFNVDYKLDI